MWFLRRLNVCADVVPDTSAAIKEAIDSPPEEDPVHTIESVQLYQRVADVHKIVANLDVMKERKRKNDLQNDIDIYGLEYVEQQQVRVEPRAPPVEIPWRNGACFDAEPPKEKIVNPCVQRYIDALKGGVEPIAAALCEEKPAKTEVTADLGVEKQCVEQCVQTTNVGPSEYYVKMKSEFEEMKCVQSKIFEEIQKVYKVLTDRKEQTKAKMCDVRSIGTNCDASSTKILSPCAQEKCSKKMVTGKKSSSGSMDNVCLNPADECSNYFEDRSEKNHHFHVHNKIEIIMDVTSRGEKTTYSVGPSGGVKRIETRTDDVVIDRVPCHQWQQVDAEDISRCMAERNVSPAAQIGHGREAEHGATCQSNRCVCKLIGGGKPETRTGNYVDRGVSICEFLQSKAETVRKSEQVVVRDDDVCSSRTSVVKRRESHVSLRVECSSRILNKTSEKHRIRDFDSLDRDSRRSIRPADRTCTRETLCEMQTKTYDGFSKSLQPSSRSSRSQQQLERRSSEIRCANNVDAYHANRKVPYCPGLCPAPCHLQLLVNPVVNPSNRSFWQKLHLMDVYARAKEALWTMCGD